MELCTAGVSLAWHSVQYKVYCTVFSPVCALHATFQLAVLGWGVSHVPGWWPRSRWPLDASSCCSLACNQVLSLTTV